MQRQQFCHLRDLSFLEKRQCIRGATVNPNKIPQDVENSPGQLMATCTTHFCIFSYYRICYVDGVFFCGINMTTLLSYIG